MSNGLPACRGLVLRLPVTPYGELAEPETIQSLFTVPPRVPSWGLKRGKPAQVSSSAVREGLRKCAIRYRTQQKSNHRAKSGFRHAPYCLKANSSVRLKL